MAGRGRGADLGALLAQAASVEVEGDLVQGERLYRRILTLDPDQADALGRLGAIAARTGRATYAVELLERAVALAGDDAALHRVLSRALELEGKPAEALLSQGKALRAEGQLAGAADCYWQALAVDSALPGGYGNLGVLLLDRGDFAGAIAHFQRALALRPGYVLAESGLGRALVGAGHPGDAIEPLQRAMSLDPRCIEAACGLGRAFHRLGDYDESAVWFERALGLRPDAPDAHDGLSRLRYDQGRFAAAGESIALVVAACPLAAAAHRLRGEILFESGRAADAAVSLRQASGLAPESAPIRSSLLLAMQCDDLVSIAELAAEHGRYEADFGSGPGPRAFGTSRDGERRLRVGFVSPDLRRGAVAGFLEPVLACRDNRQIAVVCYAQVRRPDAMTSRLKALSDAWVDTVGLDDAALAERVLADRIDILVDLAGHRPDNRLPVFARRPAPVQVSWLGYPDATGLSAIDWRFSDGVVERENVADRVMRLPRGLLCWRPPAATSTTPTPTLEGGAVPRFGCFADLSLLSPSVIAVWSEVLNAVPAARLLLLNRALGEPAQAESVRARFAGHGIAPDRLELRGAVAGVAGHLAAYGRVDVALDPFPSGDAATMCEALWMGVPVVSLRGDRPAGRVGASVLTRVGLESLVAASTTDYVALAAALTADHGQRRFLRNRLRQRVAESPLCDSAGFTRTLEAAFRAIWRRWCR